MITYAKTFIGGLNKNQTVSDTLLHLAKACCLVMKAGQVPRTKFFPTCCRLSDLHFHVFCFSFHAGNKKGSLSGLGTQTALFKKVLF